jgi:hypothetical protein
LKWGRQTEKGGGIQSINTLPIPRNNLKQTAAICFLLVTRTELRTYTLIEIWARLTRSHILRRMTELSSNTTDSHILGWADGTQTWNNIETAGKCLHMFANIIQKCSNICIMFAKN